MRIFYLSIGLYVLLVVFGQFAMAQQADPAIPELPMDKVEVTVAANTASSLVSDWDIKPHYSATGVPSGECVMSARFDNGLELAFKSKGEQLSAMRVTGFSAPQSQPIAYVGLEFDDKAYGLQSRTTATQIDASLLTVPAPGQKIGDSERFIVKIGETGYPLSTYGFDAGFNDLIACNRRYGGTTLAVVSEPFIGLRPPMMTNEGGLMPAVPVSDVMAGDAGAPEGLLPSLPSSEIAPLSAKPVSTDDMAHDDVSQWTAKKGERLEDVLTRWSEKAKVNLKVDIDKNPMIRDNFSNSGTLDQAVAQLLATIPDMGHINATLQETASQTVVADIQESQVPSQVRQERWRALQGTNLRKVLQRWSVSQNIDFIWNADQEFMVRESVNERTEFKNALSMILKQYEAQDVRPVATLNTDPQTGKTALIVTSSTAL